MASRCFSRWRPAAATWQPSAGRVLFAGAASVVLMAVLAAQQNDRARTEALASRAGTRLRALQREADRLASEERSVLADLQKLEIERQLKAAELKQIDADATKVSSDLRAIGQRFAALQAQDAAARPELRARMVELYKLGQARYLRVLLSTPDVRRVGEATRLVAALAKLDRDRVAAHEHTLAELYSTRKTLEERNRQLTALRASVQQAQTAADRALAARNALVRDIDRQRDLNAQLAGELQAAQQRLQANLSAGGTRVAASGTSEPASLPMTPFKGDLEWPAAGTPRGRFGAGPRANGIEIDTPEGAEVRAVHEGAVAFAAPFAGFGNLVIVDHGAQTFSLYGDLLEVAVTKGARVERGQLIGTSGATPAALPGLYFELRIDGQPVDPLQWLRRRPR